MIIAGLDCFEDRLVQRHLGLVAAFGERDRHHGLITRSSLRIFPGKGEDETLGLDDLAVHALFPVLGACWRAHADAESAARSDVHITIGCYKAVRPPPARYSVGFRPRSEHDIARCIEDA